MKTLTTTARARALLALGALVLTAQAPPPPWCGAVPLPRADLPSLTSNVDTQTIHQVHELSCRPLDVRAGRTTLHLAVAADTASRERGLMHVAYVPAGQGMLFAFPDGDQTRLFWMKNTITPLDMLFVKSDGLIASIAADVPATPAGTPDEKVARRDGMARYVVELGAGEAARLGIAVGQRLALPPLDAR